MSQLKLLIFRWKNNFVARKSAYFRQDLIAPLFAIIAQFCAILRNEMVQAEAIIAHNSAQWNSDWNPYLSVCSKCRTLKTWSRTVSVQVQPVLYLSQTAHDPHNPVNYQCHYHWERCHKLSGQ